MGKRKNTSFARRYNDEAICSGRVISKDVFSGKTRNYFTTHEISIQ